jgi:ureidoglycolate hydrolase
MPSEGIDYVASLDSLENCAVAKEMEIRGFGAMTVQLGYVSGRARQMNGLEYHKSSEYNIPMNDVIVLLGMQQDIVDGKYDSSKCEAFLIPGGTGVELYGTTLHYAPLNVYEDGYRMICVLPRGTTAPKVEFTEKSVDDKMCLGTNKWFMAHADAPEAKNSAYVGITGNNIKFEDLED